MKKYFFLFALFVMVLSSTLFALGNKEDSEEIIEVDEWEIPFLNCLTGPIASIGEYLQWGADLAAEEINKAGGIAGKPVKIVRIDTATSPETGVVEMSKLVDDALVVMGPVPEAVIMAAVPIAAEEGLYCFTATTSFEYAEKYFPWAISWYSPTDENLPPVASAWAEKVEAKRVVQFVENYGAWPGMAKAHASGLKNSGCIILDDIDVPVDAVTFAPLIVKALAKNPDGIILSCSAEKAAKIIIELRKRNWKDANKILVFSSADDAALYTIGGSKLNGVIIYNYNNPGLNTERWQTFRKAFKSDHNGIEPFSLSPNYYDAVYMIKRAIEETGATGSAKNLAEERQKIRDYCNNIQDFKGLQVNWSNEGGYPADKPIFLFEIRDGQKILVDEVIPK